MNSVPDRHEFGYRTPHPIRAVDFVDKIVTALEDEALPRREVTTVNKAQKMRDQKQQQQDPKNAETARPSL
jgi:hypothetical protein